MSDEEWFVFSFELCVAAIELTKLRELLQIEALFSIQLLFELDVKGSERVEEYPKMSDLALLCIGRCLGCRKK